uniref:DUF4126 domain-containing protein n=1 Tax=Alexandrium monilatum TaxID=311494 RepID=A0A7S4Q224_9DINO
MLTLLSATDGAGAVWQFHAFALATVLAGSAGIRATLPLFLVSLFHLIDPDHVPLSPQTEWLGYWFICVCLGILLIIEILADLIPAVDHALHAILTPVHAVAGALAAATPDYAGGWLARLPMAVAGAGLALSAHGSKSAFRVQSTATTAGAMNPATSICGTLSATLAIALSAFVTLLALVLAAMFIAFCVWSCITIRQTARRINFRQAGLAVIGANRFRRAGQAHDTAGSAERGRLGPAEMSAVEPAEARARPLVPNFTGGSIAAESG